MKYNFLQAIGLSFYSSDFYRDVGQNWGARAILYLLFIIALCWLPTAYIMQSFINKNLPQAINQFVDQVPTLTIKKGVVSTPESHPYFIVDPDTKKTMGIIDTSGQYKSLDNTSAYFLLTSNQIIYLTKDNDIKTHNLKSDYNFEVVPQIVKQKILSMSAWLWIFILLFGVMFSFFWRLLQSVFYSLLGLIYSSLADLQVEYSRIWILSLVSITPVIIINTILLSFHVFFPHMWLATFVLAMVYLCFAIRANRKVIP